MLSEEEREILELKVSEGARKRDLQKELQKYLDEMWEQIIAEGGEKS